MELTEEQLKKVLAGTDQEVAEEKALNNEELFRQQKLEELKQQREEIVESLNEENQNKSK